MYLTHLSLTNFRAFSRLDLDVPRRLILLVGDNAQGKTTVLEAIYYLATFTSFHAHSDRQLINFSAAADALAVGRIVAEYQRGNKKQRIEVRLIQETNGAGMPPRFRKEILVDGVKKTANEAIGIFNAVIFLPQMARILEDGPEERRHYLNLVLGQAVPGYATALSEYTQALTQRNALLKALNERGGDPDQLTFWDTIIASRGARLIQARISAIADLERHARRIHHALTHANEVLRLSYQPSFDPLLQPEGAAVGQFVLPIETPIDRSGLSLAQIENGLLQRLVSLRRIEIERGVTTTGPHRDELRFLSNTIDLGEFGSRGQVRTTLLALKLAEVAWLKERTGHWPVLLLDEIMAELDLQRRADLLAALTGCEQALLTTTDLHLFADEFTSQTALWKVHAGSIQNG
jgi:DNA replication and repair protein RecF